MKEKILGNKKNILLGTLIVGVLAMTIAFAALATNLTINGTANVAATKWNIRFEDWEKVAITEVDGHSNTAVSPAATALTKQDGSNVTKVSGVNVVLNQPGDTAKYTFEIANRGTIDAKLSNFTVTDTTSNTLVDYEVKCYDAAQNGNEVSTNYVLGVEQSIYCYMQVKYKEQSQPSQTPGTNQVYNQASEVSTNIEATWTWVQADGSAAATSGGNEQTLPSTYYYLDLDSYEMAASSTLGNWNVYVVENTAGKKVCGLLNGQTVCIEPDRWDCGEVEDDACSNSTGYIATKKAELGAMQGVSCTLSDTGLSCEAGFVSCYFDDSGAVHCSDNDTYSTCNIDSNESGGTINCFS